MQRRLLAVLAGGILALAACGGGGGGGGSSYTPPSASGSPSYTPPPVTNSTTISMGLPTGLGVENDPTWGSVGGYSQSQYSQVLAFPVGTVVTIHNSSTSLQHTLNVIGTVNAPPVSWPANPSLSTSASGGSTLSTSYASGSIAPGGSVTVTLSTAGTYLIACAYHYASNQMRDILEVSNSATPGPQATPPPVSGGGGGGYGGGW
jgi:plastocyanin